MSETEEQKFLPKKKPDAGSLVGVHYMMEFIKCPRKWFYRYYQPVTEEESGEQVHTGIEPQDTAHPLLTGGVFHTALEGYYASGIRDGEDTGEYQLEQALSEMKTAWNSRKDFYYTEEAAEKELDMVQNMIIAYYDRFGPKSPNPDYPKIKVLCDTNGEPYIEREFATPLGYSNYFLTCKADMIISDIGYVKVMEHKTSVASYITSRLSSIHHDAQFTGEIYTLNKNMPENMKLFGVKANVVQKNRSPRSKYDIAERDTTNRTAAQLADFASAAVDTLRQIDDRVANYEDWVNVKGVDQPTAIGVWFPIQGAFNGECEAYRRHCDYYSLCKQPEKAQKLLGIFKPRTKPIVDITNEN